FLSASRAPRDLHSFPTRRSSDLFKGNETGDEANADQGSGRQGAAPRPARTGPPPHRSPGSPRYSVPEQESQAALLAPLRLEPERDRKSTRLNSSHVKISYAVFCL